MANTALRTIGYLLVGAIILAAGTAVWFGINASRNTDIAQPYFEEQLPVIVGWDYQKLEPLLSSSLKAAFRSHEGQQAFQQFSQLGQFESFEQLQYVGADSQVAIGDGVYDLLRFSLLGHFREGDARVLITLAQTETSFLVHGLSLRSDVLAAPEAESQR
ncbi:hypothetical protein [Marinobacter zhejiangensis]|nr:hypothetical protein [Marinobacter zhejiangensis]